MNKDDKRWIEIDDKELEELVNVLNEIDGVATIRSCFGHSEEPERECNHDSCAFVEIWKPTDKVMNNVFRPFFQLFGPKVKVGDGWVRCAILDNVYGGNRMFFTIHSCHNPAFDERGRREKLEGIEMATKFFKEYISKQKTP